MSTLAPEMSTTTTPTAGERKYYELFYDGGDDDSSPYPLYIDKGPGGEVELTQFYGEVDRETGQPINFPSPPQIYFKNVAPLSALYDVYQFNGYDHWLISDRFKVLLEKIDPEAFFFQKTEVDYSEFSEPGPKWWVFYIFRELDCVDEARSEIEYQTDILPEKNYIVLKDVKMRSEVIGKSHAFRLTHGPSTNIVDDIIKGAIEREKIIGFRFKKIQK